MSSMILLLPDDVIHDILLRLPAPSVFACKFVCKTWFSLISNSGFVKQHLDHTVRSKKQSNFMLSIQDVTKPKPYHLVSTQNYDDALCSTSFVSPKEGTWFEMVPPFMDLAMPIHLLGTCNGLFCIMFQTSMADGPVHFLVIWNPTTGEYKVLPHSQTRVTDRDSSIYSFGYDRNNDDYKILKGEFLQDIVVNRPPSEEDVHISEVYSLRSDSWRSIETIPYHMLKYIPYDSVSGVLVNGRRHWLANNRRIHLKDLHEEFIVSFDFSEETFKQMHLPKGFLETDFWTLGVLEDRLCVTNYGCKDQLEIWVMQDYGIRESWSKHFAITVAKTMASHLRVTWSFKNDKILFKSDHRGKLVIYDPKHDTLARSWLAVRGVENYVESLVPLNSGIYVGSCQEFASILRASWTKELRLFGYKDLVELLESTLVVLWLAMGSSRYFKVTQTTRRRRFGQFVMVLCWLNSWEFKLWWWSATQPGESIWLSHRYKLKFFTN